MKCTRVLLWYSSFRLLVQALTSELISRADLLLGLLCVGAIEDDRPGPF